MTSLDPAMKLSDKALAPCPFCGVKLNYTDPNGAQHPHSDECVLSQFFLWGDEPIAAWNRRASPAPSSDLVERLERRAATMNGCHMVGAGYTYTTGYYTASDANLDREAATALTAQAARIAEQDEALAGRTQAAADVLAERRRQVEAEGWSPEHDDTHSDGEIAAAAAAYAFNASIYDRYLAADPIGFWPWDPAWFKPTDARRDLVKAGALILAEIERLDRAALGGAK